MVVDISELDLSKALELGSSYGAVIQGASVAEDREQADGTSGWYSDDSTWVAVDGLTVPARSPLSSQGRRAMIVAICVFALSVVASLFIGVYGSTVSRYSSGTSVAFNIQADPVMSGIQFVLGSIFGIWAFVQGIGAAAKNLGRRFGIAAIVISATAPFVSLIVFTLVADLK